MPRATLVLRNFFGGLADDPSPRDLREDELAELDGVHVNTEGQLTPFGGLSPDTSVGTAGNFTTVISNWGGISVDTLVAALGQGILYRTGLYTFSADRSANGSVGQMNYVAFAGVTSGAYPSDYIWAICENDGTPLSDAGESTNTFHMTTAAGGVSQIFLPMAYKVSDGVRFLQANTTAIPLGTSLSTGTYDYPIVKPQALFYAKRDHFILEGATTQTYNGWYWRANDLASPDLGFAFYLDQTYFKASGGSATVFDATDGDAFGSVAGNRFTAGIDGNYLFALNETTPFAALVTARTDSDTLSLNTIAPHSWDPTTGSTSVRDDNIAYLAPPAGRGFNLHCNFFSSGGEWESGSWEFYSTYKYDDAEQESLPFPMANWPNSVDVFSNRPSGITSVAGQKFRFALATKAPFSPRIVGGRIYAINRSQPEDGLLLIADINLEQGVRASLNDDYEPWQGWYPYYVVNILEVAAPNGDTYESINGFDPFDIDHYRRDVAVLRAHTQSSTVAMRIVYNAKDAAVYRNQVYLGNVTYWDKRYPDSIFKSYVGRQDVFVPENRLDVNADDGDEIVAIETFGDRLLVFKKTRLYVINIASEDEFYEFDRPGLGVRDKTQVVSMETGVAWFNEDGSWFFDGEQIIDTFYDLREPGRRKINLANWQSFLGDEPVFGYVKDQRSVIAISHTLHSSFPDARMMSVRTGAWSAKSDIYRTTKAVSPTFRLLSNAVVGWDNSIRILDINTQDLLEYSTKLTTQAGAGFVVKFPGLDMGEPGLQKNLHKIRITYKGSENTSAAYSIDGTSSVFYFTDTTPLPAATSWNTVTLIPATTSGSRNWYSLQLSLNPHGTFTGDVTIDDVTIIYRLKRPR